MAALAYLLLPVSGAAAYFMGTTDRLRAHGLQAVFLGLVWPLALYAASVIAPAVTQAVFIVGTGLWLVLIVGAAAGRDPKIPVVGKMFWRLAADPTSSAG